MARIRSIKPEYWDDRKLAKRASRDARLLYIALWNLADEWGRLNGDPQWIKGQVFSYDDDLNADAIGKLLEELENPALGAVIAYEADGDPYLFLPKLAKHQRLEPEKVNNGRSRLPAPPAWATSPRDPEPPPAAPAPPTSQSEPRADSSERRADSSGPDSDESAPPANSSALLYVMGAGNGVARARARAQPVPNAPMTAPAELPDDWKPSDALLRWANATYPGLDLAFETVQFCRHWRSEGRRKKSWPDAWQKWVADSHAPGPRLTRRRHRRQQETDATFDRAMQRAEMRESQRPDPEGSRPADAVRQGVLPAAAHRRVHPDAWHDVLACDRADPRRLPRRRRATQAPPAVRRRLRGHHPGQSRPCRTPGTGGRRGDAPGRAALELAAADREAAARPVAYQAGRPCSGGGRRCEALRWRR